MGTAADGGLTDDARVPTVIRDSFSSTTKAQEVIATPHGASLDSINPMPMTCLTTGSTQVDAVANVDEAQDAATTVHPEHADIVSYTEVSQLIPVQATLSIDISTCSAEVISSTATTTDTIPMATKPAPTKCSAEASAHASVWVQPPIVTIDSVDETYDTTTEHLHPPSFEHRPWPRPVQVQINHAGHLFRPSPWPSFTPLSNTTYPERPCSGIHRQSHGGPCFSPWLIRLMFRDVPLEEPIHCFPAPEMQLECKIGFSYGLVLSLIRKMASPQSNKYSY